MSLYEFSKFLVFQFFSSHSYIQIKKCIWRKNIWLFFLLLGHQKQKIVKNIFVNSGYFKKIHKSFQFFPYYCLKTFVVRGGSIQLLLHLYPTGLKIQQKSYIKSLHCQKNCRNTRCFYTVRNLSSTLHQKFAQHTTLLNYSGT